MTATVEGANGEKAVWKFGYGSNMSQNFMREKKGLNPLDSKRTMLRGFALSFPEGQGFDLVEPSFATLKRDPEGVVHGVSTLLSMADKESLDKQEGAYALEICMASDYGTGEELSVEVYVPKKPLALDFPEGCCSVRYRDILVRGAQENDLDAAWIDKLLALPTYTPSAETLARRAALPSPSELPQMSIEELRLHDGKSEAHPTYTSSCGYIFEHAPMFAVMRGRDVTHRNVLHIRAMNLEEHDDGGRSPFPRLSKLSPTELEYSLQYLDRFISKGGSPIAVVREFWEEQDVELEGVFSGNALSRL
mmetsp:Transcript_44878/g.143774  ORF Transcript_44878/g.143774 Transcript_44878/m.143774 type:complete len:306 (+) Transcript_44878:59-976(+)|eukprot:CAMPEP_0203866096 /NCGR_PEP_ID=MMETSP0359-20131031/15740_1 /ASSEMBLY_ACC=CAM_ASM_000338 /TAXON_ID=268821 /ORGANISM="Scrippsiella Hangoei, Strain SHTV-5" /LENGTH=305 /DNA_ID=CAMNT_0050784121 /DNA_START=59 /DNA_END=976 /DNA_ORIENTATION=-